MEDTSAQGICSSKTSKQIPASSGSVESHLNNRCASPMNAFQIDDKTRHRLEGQYIPGAAGTLCTSLCAGQATLKQSCEQKDATGRFIFTQVGHFNVAGLLQS